jgi:phenylpropionate dioxygenase-like ring-hydroxylating dioxygenase large terminal subunit
MTSARIDDMDLVVIRNRSGAISVWEARCPHSGASLADGRLSRSGDRLRCPFHGWEFSTATGPESGTCVAIPGSDPRKVAVTSHPVLEVDGSIFTTRASIEASRRKRRESTRFRNLDLSGWFLIARTSELPCQRIFFSRSLSLARVGGRLRVERHPAEGAPRTALDPSLVDEVDGGIFGWHHPREQAPTWRLVRAGLDDRDRWIRMKQADSQVTTQLELIRENGVDFAHFPELHHAEIDLDTVQIVFDGPRFRYSWVGRYRKLMRVHVTEEFQGLGYSLTTVRTQGFPMEVTLLGGGTALDDTVIQTRTDVYFRRGSRLRAAMNRLMLPAFVRFLERNLAADAAIWNRQVYVPTPVSGADGPVVRFRTWASRFDAAAEARA